MRNSPLFVELLASLTASLSILPDKPEETPCSCLSALWLMAAGAPVSAAAAVNTALSPLTLDGALTLRHLIAERLRGKPLAYLTGRQQFMGLEFISTPAAVIPRKDTVPLTEAVLRCIQNGPTPIGEQIVIDMFTGSGNVPLSLAKLAPGPRYFGGDLSAAAIGLANCNALHLGLESACTFRCGDMFSSFADDNLQGKVDVISGAPPFISTAKVPHMPSEIALHEPSMAFDAGPFGIALFLRLMADAPAYLKAEGWLFFEVGLGQGPGMLKRLTKDPRYKNPQSFLDEKGDIRAVAAQKA